MIDYLDKPPQRYDHVFQKNSGSREMVEDPQGEYVKFDDMDLYMFEGAQLMAQAVNRIRDAESIIGDISGDIAIFRPEMQARIRAFLARSTSIKACERD